MYRVVRSFRLIKLSYRISSKIVKMLTQKTNLDGLFSYLIYAEKYLNDDDDGFSDDDSDDEDEYYGMSM